MRQGGHPCRRCRQELEAYDAGRFVVDRGKALYASCFSAAALKEGVKELGVSRNHLIRLFRRYEGYTPREYLGRMRLREAVRLLRETEMAILQVALESGFESASAFYACFRHGAGTAPAAFRMEARGRRKTLPDTDQEG